MSCRSWRYLRTLGKSRKENSHNLWWPFTPAAFLIVKVRNEKHVLVSLRFQRVTFRSYAGSSLPLCDRNPSRGFGVAALRNQFRPGVHDTNCPAWDGKDDHSV